MKRIAGAVALVVCWLVGGYSALAAGLTVTILHTNDLHAHVEPTTYRGNELGGYARQASLIERFRATDPNPLLLCAGDTFQGTLYFTVYEGLADLAYMNFVGYQAMAIGNHEFDRGPEVLARFAALARFPLLAANLEVDARSNLAPFVKPSTVLPVAGERIGVVGAVPVDLASISSPGPTVRVRDHVASIQAAIDALAAAGVDKIILLSHLGYAEDVAVAGRLRGVDVIVGGHSHTLLGAVPHLPQPRGPYPTVARDLAGDTVLVVQAWEWGKVLGRIQVTFDEGGRVARWDEAGPVAVDSSVPEEPTVRSLVAAFAHPLAATRDRVVGHSERGIAKTRVTPRHAESPMANVVADAMLAATAQGGSVAAFVNIGGVRAGIEPGPITYGQAVTVQPFANTLVQLDLSGSELASVLEETLGSLPESSAGLLCPSHGTSYVIDLGKPPGQRVTQLMVAGKPVESEQVYRITVPSFLAAGGDGHAKLAQANRRRYDTGTLDIDAFVAYLQAHDPTDGTLEGRVTVVGTPTP